MTNISNALLAGPRGRRVCFEYARAVSAEVREICWWVVRAHSNDHWVELSFVGPDAEPDGGEAPDRHGEAARYRATDLARCILLDAGARYNDTVFRADGTLTPRNGTEGGAASEHASRYRIINGGHERDRDGVRRQ